MGTTSIEWTNATWNPLAGCRAYSPGCANCYAAGMTFRLEHMGQAKYRGLTVLQGNGRRHFNGIVRPDEASLLVPLGWHKPRRVFVNSMSDLFFGDEADRRWCEAHDVAFEPVPFDFVDRVFAVMAVTPRHTYQVLTKRPERMAEYLDERTKYPAAFMQWVEAMRKAHATLNLPSNWGWPLPNVWLGTSTEDQKRADDRIPHLLRCPAAVRFLSCEPLLGPVDLRGKLVEWHRDGSSFFSPVPHSTPHRLIDWVIAGSESGHGARPMDESWVRSLRDQCTPAGVSFFYKQNTVKGRKIGLPTLDGRQWADYPKSA